MISFSGGFEFEIFAFVPLELQNINKTMEELLFQKKFNFKKNPGWKIPETQQFYSESTTKNKYEPLQVIKRILNFVKHKLDNFKIEGKSLKFSSKPIDNSVLF